MNDPVVLSLEQVHQLAMDICAAHGVGADHGRAIADTVTAAERDGCKSHGLFRVPGYIKSVRSGKVNPTARPSLSELAPAVLRVDADGGFAPLALQHGREALIAKTRELGMAALVVNHCYHFAALWPEVEALAEQGLVGFAFTGAKSYVAPAGGSKPLFGTNPMAFAWPRPDGKPPLVFDQASSASARGEIMLHQRDGEPLPEGWAVDADGRPTTDPTAALAGAQLPFGGYKGGAIALMVELLAGALIGDLLSFEVSAADNNDGGPPRGGELILALDPGRFCADGGKGQLEHAETLFAKLLEQPGTRLPSDRRYAARRDTPDSGAEIPQSLYEELQRLRAGPD